MKKVIIIALVALLLLTGCTHYSSGMKEYADYVYFDNGMGILLSFPNPKLVFNETVGIDLITDERIFGEWLLEGGAILSLKNNGTVTFRDFRAFTRNGRMLMATHNIFLIVLDDGEEILIRIDHIDSNNSLFTLLIGDLTLKTIGYKRIQNTL